MKASLKSYLIIVFLVFTAKAWALEEPTLEWAAGGSHSQRTSLQLELKDDKITVSMHVQDNDPFKDAGKKRGQVFLGDSQVVLDAKQGLGQEWAAFKQLLDGAHAKLDAKPPKWERPGRSTEGLWLMGIKLPRTYSQLKLFKKTWTDLEARTSWEHQNGKLIVIQDQTLKIDTVVNGKRTTTLELKRSLACSRQSKKAQVCRVDRGILHI